MPPTPSPHDTVPDFIVERFADHSIEELREIARYAETLDQSENVPDYIVRAFAIQDDETRTVVAIYADELADSLEASNRAADEDESDGSDDDTRPGRTGGMFSAESGNHRLIARERDRHPRRGGTATAVRKWAPPARSGTENALAGSSRGA